MENKNDFSLCESRREKSVTKTNRKYEYEFVPHLRLIRCTVLQIMTMMAAPKNLITMPRKRRPRASAGEVFITSESVIYLMDPQQPSHGGIGDPAASSQCTDYSALRDIIYENVSIKSKPKNNSTVDNGAYTCALRMKDVVASADDNSATKGSDCESQHVSIYIGKNLNIWLCCHVVVGRCRFGAEGQPVLFEWRRRQTAIECHFNERNAQHSSHSDLQIAAILYAENNNILDVWILLLCVRVNLNITPRSMSPDHIRTGLI